MRVLNFNEMTLVSGGHDSTCVSGGTPGGRANTGSSGSSGSGASSSSTMNQAITAMADGLKEGMIEGAKQEAKKK